MDPTEANYRPQGPKVPKPKKTKIQISKSETNVRADKSQMGKIQNTESQGNSFGGFLKFAHLNLFRISDFVLRISTLNLAPWREQHLNSRLSDIQSITGGECQVGGLV